MTVREWLTAYGFGGEIDGEPIAGVIMTVFPACDGLTLDDPAPPGATLPAYRCNPHTLRDAARGYAEN